MNDYKSCFLCNSPAHIKASKGDAGNRLTVSCSNSCPAYEITKWSIKQLEEYPNRKDQIIQGIKTFTKEYPDDLPVIRKNAAFEMVVTTRRRESRT